MHSDANLDDSSRRILRAALQAFAEYGFSGASLREIARRANVHQPAIAYHYKNKEQLWKAAVNFAFADFINVLTESLEAPIDSPDRLQRLATAYVGFVSENPEWAIFIIHEGMQKNKRTTWLAQNWLTPQVNRLYRAITGNEFPEKGSAAALQAMSILAVVTGSAAVFAQQVQVHRISGVDVKSQAFIDTHAQTFECILEALQRLSRSTDLDEQSVTRAASR